MAVPTTPTGLAVDKVFSNLIEISWNTVAGADGYYLYRSLDDISYRKVGTTTSLVFYDYYLEVSTQYYYKVSAYNGDGESALSSSVNDTTLAHAYKDIEGAALLGGPFKYDENAAVVHSGVALPNRGLYANTGSVRLLNVESTNIFNKAAIYFVDSHPTVGVPGTDIDEGDWRIIRDGNNLVFQRLESSVWTTKSTITP